MKQNVEIQTIKYFMTVQKITIPLSFFNPNSKEKSHHHFSYLLNSKFGFFYSSKELKKIARHLRFSPVVEDLQNPKKF